LRLTSEGIEDRDGRSASSQRASMRRERWVGH